MRCYLDVARYRDSEWIRDAIIIAGPAIKNLMLVWGGSKLDDRSVLHRIRHRGQCPAGNRVNR
jgi:hypothetical protein